MTYLTRIADADQTNPFPIPETAHLTLNQRREYTFILTKDDGEQLLIPEKDAREVSSLIEHLAIGSAYMILGK
jgi:CRISPR/Cas system CMR subunit Cmr6 (Cas7 group RAMP superfamily)